MPRVSFPAAPASERKQAVQAVTQRGVFFGNGFVAVKIVELHFGSWREQEVGVFELEKISGEFGQLARACQ